MSLSEFYRGKKVFLTGHTGFKGSWMLQMLHLFGAEVVGLSLQPEHENDLFYQINGESLCAKSVIADIRAASAVFDEIMAFQPDLIFHLAAQPLVRRSYLEPQLTFETNVNGTLHVLEALRKLEKPCAAVLITTDKVYENKETGHPFAESDPLGGYDPYSSSKAAMEMVIQGYQKSFFSPDNFGEHHKSVIAMRAGNVIGGGDYAEDRIIPDIVSSIEKGTPVRLRNPNAVRPWQHVLEPIAGYLMAGEKLCTSERNELLPAYNIGPDSHSVLRVEEVTKMFIEFYGKGEYMVAKQAHQPHEAGVLTLDNTAFCRDFNWQPVYSAAKAIELTADWYRKSAESASNSMVYQIQDFLKRLASEG